MDNVITINDYDASIHSEILDALLRKDSAGYDPQIIEICENRAIAEMRGYLNKCYDCDALFSAVGDERNQLVLMFALDIAIYHIFCQHNPYQISKTREERYKRAVEWLTGAMDGDITIYHIFCQHNPYKMSKIRQDRYDRTIEWLKGVMNGDVTIDGAPRLPDDNLASNSRWQINASELRPTLL